VSRPRFLADEDLRYPIVLATRRLEPAIAFQTVVETGWSGISDDEVLDRAFRNGLIVVSHDVNTMGARAEARVAAEQGMSGLFLVPQARATHAVAEDVVLIWGASQAEEWDGQVVYLPL